MILILSGYYVFKFNSNNKDNKTRTKGNIVAGRPKLKSNILYSWNANNALLKHQSSQVLLIISHFHIKTILTDSNIRNLERKPCDFSIRPETLPSWVSSTALQADNNLLSGSNQNNQKKECLRDPLKCDLLLTSWPHAEAFAGSTLFSKCPWLVMFPAGKYLATTKEEPSEAVAFPTPSFLVLFHTIAVKWPGGKKCSRERRKIDWDQ